MELADLQKLLYRLIVAPNGVAEGLAREPSLGRGGLEAVISGDDRLSARERVAIYADAYFYRLLDVFKEDFPATLAALGEAHFHNLITGYLIEYPPTEPSIAFAGRHLAEFLRQHPLRDQAPFVADLALLERTLIESFHAADAAPLDATWMSAIAPEEWPALAMRLHPAARTLEVEWHVEQVLRGVERRESWKEPAHGPMSLLVWRRNTEVFYRAIESPERAALTIARDGTPFAAICEAIASASDNGDPAPLINQLLSRWLSDGVLIRTTAEESQAV
jgi:hypothetical protein